MLGILNKVLANQIDPTAVMKKLDEILAATKPSQIVNAPNGIGSIGGTLINPQVNNFGYMQKKLSEDQISLLASHMAPFATEKNRNNMVTCAMGNPNSLRPCSPIGKGS